MDLGGWLAQELDDTALRLRRHVFDLVPPERRHERPGGGNSIAWTTFHITRHAELALAVVTDDEPEHLGGDGLGESEDPTVHELDPAVLESEALAVLSAARDLIAEVPLGDWLEQFPDTEAALVRAGVPRPHHGWLFEQWVGQPAAFFVRWPLIGHAANHIGEMIATRNRMGLSPYGA